MIIHFYKTLGGKNLILDFIKSLSKEEKAEALYILNTLEIGSVDSLNHLEVKHFHEKIYEIKFRKHNRMFYVLKNNEDLYILHACKKQKNKAELNDKNLVIKRSKEIG
ncbi:MAG: type II toxin-antitoxin system RelE/ParE family toxin [Erysipelotrichaceae bacterium]|jgi:phage-related protein